MYIDPWQICRRTLKYSIYNYDKKITNIRLELKTYEINLDNSNKKIKEAGIDINTVNFLDYEDTRLDEIEGIGPNKKRDLLKYFGSSEQIKIAQLSEIKKVKGINKNIAKKIYNFFHEN